MLHFIAGVLVGSLAATYAIAKRLEMYWRARCMNTTMGVKAESPALTADELVEAEAVCE